MNKYKYLKATAIDKEGKENEPIEVKRQEEMLCLSKNKTLKLFKIFYHL